MARSVLLPARMFPRAAVETRNQKRRASRRRTARSAAAPMVGELIAHDNAGRWLVDFLGNPNGALCVARTTIPLCQQSLGKAVLLVFENGDIARPIITGILQEAAGPANPKIADLQVDGSRVTVTAQHELVLRCGKASITLTRAGKVMLRGTYVLSRSSGVNSIKGGSIQIN